MKLKNSLLSATALVLALGANLTQLPAQSRDHDHDHDQYQNNNSYNNGNRYGNNGNHYGQRRYRHARIEAKKAYRAQAYDWNTERGMYNRNWNRISDTIKRAMDAQMRAQWMAYHNNNYNGSYSWNNYNDPKFIDYLHTSNPSLLTTLRTNLGF